MPNTTIKQKKKNKEEMRNALRNGRGVRSLEHIFWDLHETMFLNDIRNTPIDIRKLVNEAEALEVITYLMSCYKLEGIVSSKKTVMFSGKEYENMWKRWKSNV